MTNYGYCCINLTLAEQDIKVGRKMIKKTFDAKGIEYAGQLALLNVNDMCNIIKLNNDNEYSTYAAN